VGLSLIKKGLTALNSAQKRGMKGAPGVNRRPEHIKEAAKGSLKRLKVDTIDLAVRAARRRTRIRRRRWPGTGVPVPAVWKKAVNPQKSDQQRGCCSKMQRLNPKKRIMSGAKQEFGLPPGVWMLVGGLAAVMVGYMLGGVLTTTTYLDFLLPHAAVPVNITTNNNNDEPARANPMGPSGQAPTSVKPPSTPPGKIVLQVAAVVREDNARALANALKQKGFPAFVSVANADNLFRVQVGPYTDRQSAQPTALALERQGLQVFIRSQ
jgi:hypothetical protein